jgi:hypothetical protein
VHSGVRWYKLAHDPVHTKQHLAVGVKVAESKGFGRISASADIGECYGL